MHSCFVKDTRIVTRCIAGETVIVPVRHDVANLDSIFTLNEIGSRIWDLINERTSLTDMVQLISDEYDVTPSEAAKDIGEFLMKLQGADLIHPVPPTAESQG